MPKTQEQISYNMRQVKNKDSAMCAYPLAKHNYPGSKFFFKLIFLSLMFTLAVISIPTYFIVSKLNLIDRINIELAFMSASAFSADAGFTVSNINEAELKRKVISRAKKVIMLVDSSKIGKDLLFTLADISDIHVLITDAPLSAEIQQLADAHGVTVIS